MRYTTRCVAACVLGLTVSLAAGFGGDEEMTDNPFYKHWAGFKEGTTVVHTERTTFGDDATDELPGGVDEKIVRYKLASVSPKRVVLEVVVIEKDFDPKKILNFVNNPKFAQAEQRRELDLLNTLEKIRAQDAGSDPQVEAVISSMETAYRMQTEAPEVFDITREPEKSARSGAVTAPERAVSELP